jgi:hypothetical protein
MIGAFMNLMEASLLLNFSPNSPAIHDLILSARERSKLRNQAEAVAESFYLEGMLFKTYRDKALESFDKAVTLFKALGNASLGVAKSLLMYVETSLSKPSPVLPTLGSTSKSHQ